MGDRWKSWMLECKCVCPIVVNGWHEYEEVLLLAARRIEEIEEVQPQTIPFGKHAAEVRHILVAVKLLCHDRNPYGENLDQAQWTTEADAEMGQYPWAVAHATMWATGLAYVCNDGHGGVLFTKVVPPARQIMMDVPH